MSDRVQVVYENGVLRPLSALPPQIHEHQRLTVTIEDSSPVNGWLAGADPTATLDAVRSALAKAPEPLAELIRDERDAR